MGPSRKTSRQSNSFFPTDKPDRNGIMDHATHSNIVNFIWGIIDDVLRDLYVRGKYRDVILPMTVLRRLDAVLEASKKDVLEMKAELDEARITHQDAALRQAAGQDFYNTSKFTLSSGSRGSPRGQINKSFLAIRWRACCNRVHATTITPSVLRRDLSCHGPR
jgi:type I restriction-modification system DNA methylase subunit